MTKTQKTAKPAARKGTRSLSTAEAVRKLAKAAPAKGTRKIELSAKEIAAQAKWDRALAASEARKAKATEAQAFALAVTENAAKQRADKADSAAHKLARAVSMQKPATAAVTAKAAKPAEAIEPLKYRGVWAEVAEAAAKGKVPAAPDFDKPTHAGYRGRLAKLVALVAAGDLPGLAAADMQPPASSSRLALWRYRDLAMIALRAQATSGKAKGKQAA